MTFSLLFVDLYFLIINKLTKLHFDIFSLAPRDSRTVLLDQFSALTKSFTFMAIQRAIQKVCNRDMAQERKNSGRMAGATPHFEYPMLAHHIS
jgi:hypothetical protein